MKRPIPCDILSRTKASIDFTLVSGFFSARPTRKRTTSRSFGSPSETVLLSFSSFRYFFSVHAATASCSLVRACRMTPKRNLLDFLALANTSSELEFFRHRIHVERDSVRRAREALRHQENAFHGRQKAWKQRSARATLEQLVQEERELSEMEVSLHRTRSLLGEKVIHLRHLEQSLDRVASAKRNENEATSTRNDELTLSDMSSASSGFSSTDLGTDTFIDKPDHYQESTGNNRKPGKPKLRDT